MTTKTKKKAAESKPAAPRSVRVTFAAGHSCRVNKTLKSGSCELPEDRARALAAKGFLRIDD